MAFQPPEIKPGGPAAAGPAAARDQLLRRIVLRARPKNFSVEFVPA